jgi:alcohol dehydrogenase (cytochrome c)
MLPILLGGLWLKFLAEPVLAADVGPTPANQAYRTYCASCHGQALGGGFGPPLIGAVFKHNWQSKGVESLLAVVSKTMPPGKPNELDPHIYQEITDWIFVVNGIPLGQRREDEIKSNPSTVSKAQEIERSEANGGTVAEANSIMNVNPENEDDTFQKAVAERLAAANMMRPVTDDMLRNPPVGDWLHFRRDYASQGYSPLSQININNARKLRVAWTLSLLPGTNGITPLVHDGVIFIDSAGTVEALRAIDGEVIWKFARPVKNSYIPVSQPRGLGLLGTMLYVGTSDNHIIALDARTGKRIWDHQIAPPEAKLQITGAPLIVSGKVIQGMSACMGHSDSGGCFIVALDAANGSESWRFETVARPGEPHGNSWNGQAANKRSGAGVWTAGSYDAKTNLAYFGTGQTYDISSLLKPVSPGMTRDALYTDTTLALDPHTGRLVWHYQHMPRDIWDFDWAFEQILIDLPNKGGTELGTVGKLGILDLLDAKNGRYLASVDLGLQNVVDTIDPVTGHKNIKSSAEPSLGKAAFLCPYIAGARGWPATAYNPATKTMYVPLFEWCMDYQLTPDTGLYQWSVSQRKRPDSDGNFGRVSAIDVETRKITWTQRRRAPQASAILATAGGLIFEGGRDRWFRASDASTGTVLWQIRLNATPNSFPISFSANGIQYIAVVAGGGSILDSLFPFLTPEIDSGGEGTTLWVLKLDETS